MSQLTTQQSSFLQLEQFSTAFSSINEALSSLEKEYLEKFESQQILINKLQAEIDELRSYIIITHSLYLSYKFILD